ncbi:FixH family protein [Paenibacillus arenilitoris]|uniref:YtkA-like domain-containing protein n=1 Tax=Paenibacillus arenilitoris TaxID=2772299 RepID=A0A927H5X4_9BACL|nr:FixH family protein [Paenibacillus arenilitoris]MBD2869926.1 hypothetical protein [Paenibacillus arenilitoris]
MPLFRLMRLALAVIPLIAALGCGSVGTVTSIEADPPTRGLLAMLQREQAPTQEDRGYRVEIGTPDGSPIGAGETELVLRVTDADGEPVSQFREDMTKLMHLILVSGDLSSFQHLHPEHEGDGVFRVRASFPFAGRFLLTTEFKPDRKDVTVVRQWATVAGEARADAVVEPDLEFVKQTDGLRVTLSASPAVTNLKAGQMVMLLFRLADGKTGEPVKELEPFLGTSGHCVILNREADQYVHAHAAEGMSGGANVMFHAVFPEKGVYKLWGQFQHEGRTITVPFVVNVG